MVAGDSLEFDDMPFQPAVPHSSFSKGEELIAVEIKKLLEKGVINEASHGTNENISIVITTTQKNGSHSTSILKWNPFNPLFSRYKRTTGWQ